ncbi:MAG: acyl-homoserine-lactone synthase [Candidatus Paracaedibacteraceae bacterium]|nr:acyl-homoserine-lactone synthase [Candidatus Paracaedibacteraceae bacterium]
MLHLIEPTNYDVFRDDLESMYRLRYKVFFEKKKWKVNHENQIEKDEYDENSTYYLIYKDAKGIVRGCIRFIEMIHPCMFDTYFADTLPDIHEFKRPGYWETSRFAVDTALDEDYQSEMQGAISKLLLYGLMKFGLESKKVETYLTLAYPAVKRLTKRSGLYMYDINETLFHGEKISIFAFPPMTYSSDKLMVGVNESLKYESRLNLGNLNEKKSRTNILNY